MTIYFNDYNFNEYNNEYNFNDYIIYQARKFSSFYLKHSNQDALSLTLGKKG